MFSYFEGGVTNTYPNHTIDLSCLIRIIKNHHDIPSIEHIRQLRRNGDESYQELKKKLIYITPNCTVRIRNFKTEDLFQQNFVQSSGYLYYDFDVEGDPYQFKENFINKYKDVVAMVSLSVSLGGISVLVRVDKFLSSKSEHNLMYEAIRSEYFPDLKVDPDTKDITRCWYISSDPDVYVNYENLVLLDSIKKFTPFIFAPTQGIAEGGGDSILKESKNYVRYEIKPFKDCLEVVKTTTDVEVDQPVVEHRAIAYSSFKFPRIIRDGNKRTTYKRLVYTLCHLNNEIEPDYIFSFLYHVNESIARPKMDDIELLRLFNSLYNKIKNDPNYVYKGDRIKHIHFNKRTKLSGEEKKNIALRLNGKIKKNKSKDKILAAVEELKSQGKKLTLRAISAAAGLAVSTVSKHYNKEKDDIDLLINEINQGIPTSRLDKNPWDSA